MGTSCISGTVLDAIHVVCMFESVFEGCVAVAAFVVWLKANLAVLSFALGTEVAIIKL